MISSPSRSAGMRPEIWGGLECTVNRVGDRFNDQCEMNGHDDRLLTDLARFASLGIKKIRYPVVWEKVAPESLDRFDFSRSDLALAELRGLGVDAIVGLCHHGSGPLYTSLLDPEFPEKLARYAIEVARRYPWVEHFTPVNEPLTTARFSGLYGVWYPHRRDDPSMVRALFHELKATVLAMRAIREINPKAKLVQTDDMGRAGGTPRLQYQVDFENERRWLTFDLLAGRVDRQHPIYAYLRDAGRLTEAEIEWFLENPCPADIIGINHYPLSNRFLDHRLELYPEPFHGGNGRDRYADVGAVDTGQAHPPKPVDILREVWERYRTPFAVTEAHIAGPREAQMRWLKEVWEAGCQLASEGAEMRAVTAWSLLGAFDWSTLCTASPCRQFYESGVFDARGIRPRPTGLARMIRQYARGAELEHPVLERPGYWHEPTRVLFAPTPEAMKPSPLRRKSRPVLITGANGTLGQAFARVCEVRGIDHVLVSRKEMDITSHEQVRSVLRELKPWALVNAAGYVRVDEAENDRERCRRENTLGPGILAEECADQQTQLLTFSSDLVFDGNQRDPYRESHATSPLNVYGLTKAAAETIVTERNDRALVVRTSAFFGPWDRHNFLVHALRLLRRGQEVRAIHEMTVSPTYVPDLAFACLDLLIDGEKGLVHLANQGEITWADWARMAASMVGRDRSLVVDCRMEDLGMVARRPAYSALSSERVSGLMPGFEQAMHAYMQKIRDDESVLETDPITVTQELR